MAPILKKKNSTKLKIYLDIIFLILMILVLIPQSTGIPIHEWASFLILIPFLFHLIINWEWIATNSTSLFKTSTNKSRFNYVLNWILYLNMLIVTVSGIVISESVLPLFGIITEPDNFWTTMHKLSATLIMVVLGIHISQHWKWILITFKNLKLKTDLHHLTEIKDFIKKYSSQLLILILVSTFLSLLFWFLNYTEWADGFRTSSDLRSGEEAKVMPQSWLNYLLPFVKVTVFITIPALIAGAISRLKKTIKKID